MAKDLSKPCERCGTVDRYKSVGRCRRCWREYTNARHADPTYRRPRVAGAKDKPCRKCGANDRGKAGECRPCHRAYKLAGKGKPCVKCGEIKTGETGACLGCGRRYAKARSLIPEVRERQKLAKAAYLAKPEVIARRAARQRFLTYGITEAEQAAMLAAQNNCCDSCGDPLDASAKGGKGMHLDHDHKTGEIHAFVCYNCNVAVGHVKDSPERARKLAAYLERHQPKLKLAK